MPPEAQRHPQMQADRKQAEQVLQEHVQQLESQKEPLSEAQKKELADAKAALGWLRTPLPGQQHISGGRPELPEGAKLLQSSEHWFIYEQGGKKWVRFYAPEARSPNNVVKGGTGSQTDKTSALLNPEGRIYVEEGQHRLTGVVKDGTTNQNTVPVHPQWLEYEFHGDTEAVGHPPDYSDQKPFKFDSDNPYTNLEGYD